MGVGTGQLLDTGALFADARATVEASIPDGWHALMIRSPWSESECPSPACAAPLTADNFGVAVLTKRLERARVLLFTMTFVCGDCADDGARLGALAALTFQ